MTKSKRSRGKFYAVLKDHRILTYKTERELADALASERQSHIIFVSRGVRLMAEFTKRPAVELTLITETETEDQT